MNSKKEYSTAFRGEFLSWPWKSKKKLVIPTEYILELYAETFKVLTVSKVSLSAQNVTLKSFIYLSISR